MHACMQFDVYLSDPHYTEKVAIMRILNHNTKRLVNDFKNILEKKIMLKSRSLNDLLFWSFRD